MLLLLLSSSSLVCLFPGNSGVPRAELGLSSGTAQNFSLRYVCISGGNQNFGAIKVGFFLLSLPFLSFFSPFLFDLAVNGKQNEGLIEQMLDFTYASHDTDSPMISFHLHKTYTLHGYFCGTSDIFFQGESISQPSALPTLTIHIITTNAKGSRLR